MGSYKKDYNKLYLLQDKFLCWFRLFQFPFYLTGGTALGRFYLNHRFSEDLDFFVNADPDFGVYIDKIKKEITNHFDADIQQSLFTDDFCRIFIEEKGSILKIEFVNDVAYRAGQPMEYNYGKIDTPENILANKLTAIVGRDEPKDVFDIIHLSLNYSFNWQEIFFHSKEKTVINEIDVEERLYSFPVEWFENIHWILSPVEIQFYKNTINQIADDFLLGKGNSLGAERAPINKATPLERLP